ncbi:MAG TPA: hypothetical protein VL053_06945 [Arachidicoccus sp.]|nr:hypothetical protein [Arachidicoccus sp.]
MTSASTTATVTTTQTLSGEMFTESSTDIQRVVYPSTNYFGFDLGYDKASSLVISAVHYDSTRFNGDIAGMSCKGANDKKLRKYDFSYDQTSRLTGAKFDQYVGSGFSNTLVNYDVNNLKYDANGNILSMNQYGLKSDGTSALIDQLTYSYLPNSNKLLNVKDDKNDLNSTLGDFKYAPVTKTATTLDYTNDGNGNMTSDKNKKISSIIYNYLNLPSVITVTGKGVIRYYYDAAGNKLQKRTTDNTVNPAKTIVTTYIGGAVYQNDTLQFFGTDEGRVRPNTADTGWVYDYFLKDHLGNTRMMITDDYNVSSPILEANSYYPFGLEQKTIGLEATGNLHNYKNTFQNQEYNEDLGANIYEFKYRVHDPQIGRFWQIDPLTDKYVYNSTYAFSENKVTTRMEMEGLEISNFWDWFIQLADRYNKSFDATVRLSGDTSGGSNEKYIGKVGAKIVKAGAVATDIVDASAPYRDVLTTTNTLASVVPLDGVIQVAPEVLSLSLLSKTTTSKISNLSLREVSGAAEGSIEAANGIKITGFTSHGVDRAIGSFGRSGVKPNAILDAIKNPLKINNVVTDQLDRQSQRFIGQFGEVVVNPQTGRIISVNPTSSRKAAKLLKQLGQ